MRNIDERIFFKTVIALMRQEIQSESYFSEKFKNVV